MDKDILEIYVAESNFLKETLFKIKRVLQTEPDLMGPELALYTIDGILQSINFNNKLWRPDDYEL